ncbi:hypothetical protein [Nodularia sp. UHCC 0506]|nr:hypothetical protein [Nodularia sp. UHCC 0506]MEA5514285.1 hypothetical protein [Nodularia sp. UHCC 0506]
MDAYKRRWWKFSIKLLYFFSLSLSVNSTLPNFSQMCDRRRRGFAHRYLH